MVVIALDINAFYCAVEERQNPQLRDVPFAVTQKQIVATLSYAARNLGLKKLMRISDATKLVPNLILINGENLSKYRAEGKFIYELIKHDIFHDEVPVERLGFEEFRFDVSKVVQYNIQQLRRRGIIGARARARCDADDDELTAMGWDLHLTCDGTSKTYCQDFFFNIPGHVFPESQDTSFPTYAKSLPLLQLYIGAHIASYVADHILVQRGYTVSAGVAVNKTLAKMVGNCHKPAGLTSLLPESTQTFLDDQRVRAIPGFGFRTEQRVAERLDQEDLTKLTVHFVRTSLTEHDFTEMFKSQGSFLWDLLHGKDTSPIKDSEGLPSQISVEDTYTPGLRTPQHIRKEISKLLTSVLTQAQIDLEECDENEPQNTTTWKIVPTIVKLTVKDTLNSDDRKSRSARLPAFFEAHLGNPTVIVERLIEECVWKLFTAQVRPHYEVRLINVALTNFIEPASKSEQQLTSLDTFISKRE